MSATVLLSLLVVVLAVGLFVFRAIPGVRVYFNFRGKRLITCPETHKTEAVNVDAGEAAVGAFLSEPTLRLKECSRWPEREDCGQECLKQIEADRQGCLVWSIVKQWYEGKSCVFCHQKFGTIHHFDHCAALLAPDRKTIEWTDVRPQQLPEVLRTHQPVCWNCHVAETFRRLCPELVVDREPAIRHIR